MENRCLVVFVGCWIEGYGWMLKLINAKKMPSCFNNKMMPCRGFEE
jgi:hypothetical protein